MPNVGPLELAIVLIIALVVFGPKRLPELGKSVGRGIREFKGSISGDNDDDDEPEQQPWTRSLSGVGVGFVILAARRKMREAEVPSRSPEGASCRDHRTKRRPGG